MSQIKNNINYTINDIQAKEIAYCIFSDIADYIENNKDKYKQWLVQQNMKGGE